MDPVQFSFLQCRRGSTSSCAIKISCRVSSSHLISSLTDRYQATPPTLTSDAVCNDVTLCGAGLFIFQEESATSDRVCARLSNCPQFQYEIQAPTETSNRLCRDLTRTCGPGTFQSVEASLTSGKRVLASPPLS